MSTLQLVKTFAFDAGRWHLNDWHLTPCIIAAICCLLIFILLCISHVRYRNNKKYLKIRASIKWYTFICIFCNMAMMISLIIYDHQFNPFADLFGGVAEITVYILFLNRLFNTFQGTTYQSSMCHYCLLYLLLLSYIVMQIWLIILDFMFDINCIPKQLWSEMHLIQTILNLIIDFTLTIWMLSLFIKKLFAVGKAIGSESKYNVEKATKLMNTIAKLTIITSLCLITNQITSIWIVINFAYYYCFNAMYNKIIFSWVLECMLVIDTILNSLCVFILITFSNRFYHCLCGKLHRFCKNSAINELHRQIEYQCDNDDHYQLLIPPNQHQSIDQSLSVNIMNHIMPK